MVVSKQLKLQKKILLIKMCDRIEGFRIPHGVYGAGPGDVSAFIK
jgi:hypothetical protein